VRLQRVAGAGFQHGGGSVTDATATDLFVSLGTHTFPPITYWSGWISYQSVAPTAGIELAGRCLFMCEWSPWTRDPEEKICCVYSSFVRARVYVYVASICALVLVYHTCHYKHFTF
jgi:hypothetical protein